MKIYYANRKLEKILSDERLIKKHYTPLYKKLIIRLSEIKVASSLEDIPHIPPPRRHKLDGDFSECWGIDISKNYRIVISPFGEWDQDDVKTINAIEIRSIEDYH